MHSFRKYSLHIVTLLSFCALIFLPGCKPDYVTATCGGGYKPGVRFYSVQANHTTDPLHGEPVVQYQGNYRSIDNLDPIRSGQVSGAYIPLCQYKCTGFKDALTAYRTKSQNIANDPEYPANVRAQAQQFLIDYPMSKVTQLEQQCGKIQFDVIKGTGSKEFAASIQMAHERCQCQPPQGLSFLTPGAGDITSVIQKGFDDQLGLRDPRAIAQRASASKQQAIGSTEPIPVGTGSLAATAAPSSLENSDTLSSQNENKDKIVIPKEVEYEPRNKTKKTPTPLASKQKTSPFGSGINPVSQEDPYLLNPKMNEHYTSNAEANSPTGKKSASASSNYGGISFFSSGLSASQETQNVQETQFDPKRSPAHFNVEHSPDPEDYFVRLNTRDSLFKSIEKQYRQVGYRWALEELRLKRQEAK